MSMHNFIGLILSLVTIWIILDLKKILYEFENIKLFKPKLYNPYKYHPKEIPSDLTVGLWYFIFIIFLGFFLMLTIY